MKNIIDYGVVLLSAIEKGPPLNSSPRLIILLERSFSFVESINLFHFIHHSGYVEWDLINGIHFYRLTNNGKDFLIENGTNAAIRLKLKHPDRVELLDKLLPPPSDLLHIN